ncbi:F-box/kelch-repeat protein, partial [Mucuna pruriens]
MSQAQYLPVLPPELIVEVLSWVPVNHLMRFRCVCKTWKSIIFDPTFVKLQLKRSSKRTHILITAQEAFDDIDYHYGDTYSIPYPIDQLFENPYSINDEDIYYELKAIYWIIGSCNGLVCLGGHNTQDDFEEYWIRFWNPATRMRSKKSPFFRVNTCCQRFEPSTSMRFGFVYDDLSDIYKVVSIFLDCSSKKTEALAKTLSHLFQIEKRRNSKGPLQTLIKGDVEKSNCMLDLMDHELQHITLKVSITKMLIC